jgi:hypothetical protein
MDVRELEFKVKDKQIGKKVMDDCKEEKIIKIGYVWRKHEKNGR